MSKQALKSKPKSPFYLDSLAWGYYKLKQYKKAYKTMEQVVLTTGLDNIEIKRHWDIIKKSVKKKKTKKKKKKKK